MARFVLLCRTITVCPKHVKEGKSYLSAWVSYPEDANEEAEQRKASVRLSLWHKDSHKIKTVGSTGVTIISSAPLAQPSETYLCISRRIASLTVPFLTVPFWGPFWGYNRIQSQKWQLVREGLLRSCPLCAFHAGMTALCRTIPWIGIYDMMLFRYDKAFFKKLHLNSGITLARVMTSLRKL